MDQWEYMVIQLADAGSRSLRTEYDEINDLDDLGLLGWELAGIATSMSSWDRGSVYAHLKRKIEQGEKK